MFLHSCWKNSNVVDNYDELDVVRTVVKKESQTRSLMCKPAKTKRFCR